MRCKHANLLIHEEYVTATTHYIEDNEYAGSLSIIDGSGEYSGKLHFHCQECGMMRTYNRYVSIAGFRRLPKWIRESAEAAGIPFVIVGR